MTPLGFASICLRHGPIFRAMLVIGLLLLPSVGWAAVWWDYPRNARFVNVARPNSTSPPRGAVNLECRPGEILIGVKGWYDAWLIELHPRCRQFNKDGHSDYPILIIKASACIIGTTTDPKRHDALDLATARKRCDSEAGETGFKHGFLRPRIPEIDKVLPNACRSGMDQDQFYCFGVGKRR